MGDSSTRGAALSHLESLLNPEELITPDSPLYKDNSQTWATQKDLRPQLVIRPRSTESLSKAISYLYKTDLDFAVRGRGCMSTSAQDVLISMTAFDEFRFDSDSKTVLVGAGLTWSDVFRQMESTAPQYTVVGARTPSVGVAGTIVSGGISWISSEFGCISDPTNLLDAEVVKYDGSVTWAATEPDLMWALRGGGGGFGAATRFVLRAHQYPQEIWSGPILIPRDQLPEVARAIAKFVSTDVDPRITMFLYVIRKKLLKSVGADQDMLLVHAFDANGEDHGRKAFAWALNIPGAIDQTKINNIRGVAALQDKMDSVKGTMKQFWSPMMLRDVSEKTVLNAIEWFDSIGSLDEAIADCTYLIFELLASRDPILPISNCAWPRPSGAKHILLIGTGCPSDADAKTERAARDLAANAPTRILGEQAEFSILPNGLEDYHDKQKIWGNHLPHLKEVKRRYDPKGRFKGAIAV